MRKLANFFKSAGATARDMMKVIRRQMNEVGKAQQDEQSMQ